MICCIILNPQIELPGPLDFPAVSDFLPSWLESQDDDDGAAAVDPGPSEEAPEEEPALQSADRMAEMLSPKGVRHRGARIFGLTPDHETEVP